MSASTINTVIAALRTAASFNERVSDIRATLDKATLADKAALADALRPGVARFYGITLELKSTGRAVFPSEHANTDSARTALSKLVRAVQGPVSHQAAAKPVVRVAKAERSAYEAFLAACGGDTARMSAVIKACKV